MKTADYITINKKTDIDNLNNNILWALEYISEYKKSGGDFDPFTLLTGTENRKQKLYYESLQFLIDLERAANDYIDARRKCL